MTTLETIFSGLNSIAGTIFSNQSQSIRNDSLSQYNQLLLAQMQKDQQKTNMPTYLAIGGIVFLIVFTLKNKR